MPLLPERSASSWLMAAPFILGSVAKMLFTISRCLSNLALTRFRPLKNLFPLKLAEFVNTHFDIFSSPKNVEFWKLTLPPNWLLVKSHNASARVFEKSV